MGTRVRIGPHEPAARRSKDALNGFDAATELMHFHDDWTYVLHSVSLSENVSQFFSQMQQFLRLKAAHAAAPGDCQA